eukprot:1879847-Heterocapsa_arctica.AAC.1
MRAAGPVLPPGLAVPLPAGPAVVLAGLAPPPEEPGLRRVPLVGQWDGPAVIPGMYAPRDVVADG